jgi:hypothetical protein
MLDTIIARWRLYRALRRPASGGSHVSAHCLIALQRPAARDWMARRGIRDVRALGPSSPPQFNPEVKHE